MKNNLNAFIILEQEEGFKELEVANDQEEEGTKRGISILNKSLLSARKRLELEAQKISVKAKVNLYSQNIEGLFFITIFKISMAQEGMATLRYGQSKPIKAYKN